MAAGRWSLGQRAIEPSGSVIDAAQVHLWPGERVVAQISTSSPGRAMAVSLGSAAGDAVGTAVGSAFGAAAAVLGDAAAAKLTQDGGGNGPSQIDRLQGASEVLLVLTTERLFAFAGSTGERLLATLAPGDLAGVTVEPSKVSPTNAVLAVGVVSRGQPIRLEGPRSSVRAFAEALSSVLGSVVEQRPVDRWFLPKAVPVGLLYTFGVGCLLLVGPVAADGGAGPALQVGAMGAAGVAGGEALRRLLFRRMRRRG